jgi:hypothetical protein
MNTGLDGFRILPFRAWWPVGFGAIAGLLLRLVFSGKSGDPYVAMMASFIIGSPVLVSVVTVYLAERVERRTWGYYFVAPFVANLMFVVGTLLIEVEGWICAIVIVPLFAVIGGLVGLVMGAICRVTHWPRRAIVSSVALLPLLGGAVEQRVHTTRLERVQQRDLVIAAAPEDIWRVLVDTRDIRPAEVQDAWMYRIGVPTPTAGIGDFRAGEHLRHITMARACTSTRWPRIGRKTGASPGAIDSPTTHSRRARSTIMYASVASTSTSRSAPIHWRPCRRHAALHPHALQREHALQLVCRARSRTGWWAILPR